MMVRFVRQTDHCFTAAIHWWAVYLRSDVACTAANVYYHINIPIHDRGPPRRRQRRPSHKISFSNGPMQVVINEKKWLTVNAYLSYRSTHVHIVVAVEALFHGDDDALFPRSCRSKPINFTAYYIQGDSPYNSLFLLQ